MEVICVNDSPINDPMGLFQHWIVKDQMYTIQDVVKTASGDIGLILEECPNKPAEHPSGLGTFMPSYNIKRFKTLGGEPLDVKQIKQSINAKL